MFEEEKHPALHLLEQNQIRYENIELRNVHAKGKQEGK